MDSAELIREHRRDARYRVQIPAVLIRGKKSMQLLTDDVSYRGVFLRMDDPPNLRQLVQIRLTLPPDAAEVTFHGMAVHVVHAEESPDRCPGVGVQFYAVDGIDRVRWESFIRGVRSKLAADNEKQLSFAPPDAPDPTRRKYPRIDARLRLWVSNLGQIHKAYTENLSKGGLLIAADVEFDLDRRIQMMVMHPTNGSGFPMEAIVRRKVNQDDFRGIGVEIVPMNAERERSFFDFLGTDLWVSIDLEDLLEGPPENNPVPQIING